VRKSKEESTGNGARDARLLDTRLLSAPADKLQRSNKFRARRHWSAIVSCFVLWRKNPPQRIFALCPVAVANSAACSPLFVPMQQIGRMAEYPLAQPMREWLPEIDFGVMHHGFAPRGHTDPSGGGACEVTSLNSWSCNTKRGYDEVQLCFARFRNDA
jgi:hypothetical protein